MSEQIDRIRETWSRVPPHQQGAKSDIDFLLSEIDKLRENIVRKYFCSCGGALTAEEYLQHYFELKHDRYEGGPLRESGSRRWFNACKKCGHGVCHKRATGSNGVAERELVDETQRRMDQVVEAAVEWHQSGQEGDNLWFEKSEALSAAINSLLELRSTTPPSPVADQQEPEMSLADMLRIRKELDPDAPDMIVIPDASTDNRDGGEPPELPWRDANGHAWELRRGVDCVECPDCCFMFAAIHGDGNGGGYSCPNCDGNRSATAEQTARETLYSEIMSKVKTFAYDKNTDIALRAVDADDIDEAFHRAQLRGSRIASAIRAAPDYQAGVKAAIQVVRGCSVDHSLPGRAIGFKRAVLTALESLLSTGGDQNG